MSDAEKAADAWLRDKYGAYRGHPCWREIEAGYLAGYAAAQQWRPIESAPIEGQFLVYMPDDKRQPIQVAKWHPNVKVIGNIFAFDSKTPTKWMPLPLPPSE